MALLRERRLKIPFILLICIAFLVCSCFVQLRGFQQYLRQEQLSSSLLMEGTENIHPCSKYDGILHIASGDKGAATGTLLFQYVLNQLYYAELHNLLPIIHLNDISKNVYDPVVHFSSDEKTISVSEIRNVTTLDDGAPGPPECCFGNQTNIASQQIILPSTTGIWNHYFEPMETITGYDPDHSACQSLPYISFSYEQLNPSLHFKAPWAVRSWPYDPSPPEMNPPKQSEVDEDSKAISMLHEWYSPQRYKANTLIQKYYRPLPFLKTQASQLIPPETKCLGVHIRHSDKGGSARHIISLSEYIPYLYAYLKEIPHGKIFLATDSPVVINDLREKWKYGQEAFDNNVIFQNDIARSPDTKPVFSNPNEHHTVTIQVLVDIFSLSRCQYLLHGFSAVSESVHYLSWPTLHFQSVDLEDPVHDSPEEFQQMVHETMQTEI